MTIRKVDQQHLKDHPFQNLMKISIITATYNSEKTILNTLNSVKNQTYSNIEHIIVDGASIDNTLKIVKQFDHVSKVISEPDDGIYDAMNKGIDASSGQIIGILNSDDFFYDSNVLKNIVDNFSKEQEVQIIYGNTLVGNFNSEGIITNYNRIVKPGKFKASRFISGWMPSHVSVYVRKETYQEYGKFKLDYHIGADYELMLRLMYKYKVKSKYIDMFCVKFRVGGISTASVSNRMLTIKDTKKAWIDNNLKFLPITPFLKIMRGVKNVISTKLTVFFRLNTNT